MSFPCLKTALFIVGLKPNFLTMAPAFLSDLISHPSLQFHQLPCRSSFPQTPQTDFYFWPLSPFLPPWTGGPQGQGHLPREVFQIFLAEATSLQGSSHPQAVSNLFTAPVSV